MKKLVISTLFVLQVVFVFAQSTGFSGKVLDSKTQKPLQNVVASIQNTSLTSLTDVTGVFAFNNLTAGSQLLQIKSSGYKDQLLVIEVEEGKIKPDANLRDTLELDSLDYVDLVVVIESNFGFKVKGEDFTTIHTFQDFYNYCHKKDVNQPVAELGNKQQQDTLLLFRL